MRDRPERIGQMEQGVVASPKPKLQAAQGTDEVPGRAVKGDLGGSLEPEGELTCR